MKPWLGSWQRIRNRWSGTERELRRLRKLPRYQPTTTTLLGPTIRLVDGPSFYWSYLEIFRNDFYAFPSHGTAPRILDCGANVGASVIYFRRRYPDARITAFEPDPNVFSALVYNVQRSVGIKGIELIRAAVWSGGESTIPFCVEGADAGHVPLSPESRAATTVPAAALSEYLREDVDLLKVDIEGAELCVLQDCASQLHRVRNLFVEYHSFSSQPQRLNELLTILRDAGFRVHVQSSQIHPQPLLRERCPGGMDLQLNIFGFRDREAVAA